MTIYEMVPGERYRVTWEDCCVSGTAIGTFLRFAEYDGEVPYRAVFDFGWLETLTGYRVEEFSGCCVLEERDFNGGCINCGDPCL